MGIQTLSLAYGMPVAISVCCRRREVNNAQWNLNKSGLGWIVNVVALGWIAFELVLFSMPTALPVTTTSMNYASVVLVGFASLALLWYFVYAHKCYRPPSYEDL